jgi:hypothetical protein
MAATLITIDQARAQCRIIGDAQDTELIWKMAQAEDVILRYLKPALTDEPRPDWPWTIDTVPPAAQDAILLYLGHLWRNRGDALDAEDEQVWLAIERRTAQLRDKALA